MERTSRRHRLLMEIGRGGMGTVYLAVSEGPKGFNKVKVIKQLRHGLLDDPESLDMFLDEARLAARLNHPNIVQTNEVGFDGRDYFIEMEYLEGQPYAAVARRARKDATLSLEMHLWILAQALTGLHHAHELKDHDGAPLGVVHRDVSPHNVFITYDGMVKLLDLGIAKAADSSSETRTGVVKGKATYMAPEQAVRGPIDRRADIFAVGVMLWEACVGKRMWGDLPELEIFAKLKDGAIPRAQDERPDLAPALEAIVSRALAPAPADRFATAEEMQVAIEAHLEAVGARIGQRQVGKLVATVFAERREAVQREIDAQLGKGGGGGSVPVLQETEGFRGTATGRTARAEGENESVGGETRSLVGSTRGDAPRALRRSDSPGEETSNRLLTHTSTADARPRSRRLFATGLAAIVAIAGVAGAVTLYRHGEGERLPAAGAPKCVSNAACTAAQGGRASICRHDTGACVELESADCKPVASAAEWANENTVWFGSMLPLSGGAARDFGRANANVLELARRDFAMVGGLPPLAEDGPLRPIGLLQCDDAVDAKRAAAHLMEVGVPAVMGFGTTAEALELMPTVLLPKRVIVLDMMSASPLITKIPQPAGVPRLVWRTTSSAAQFGQALAHLVADWLEPGFRRPGGVLAGGGAMRVALVRSDSAHAFAIADGLLSDLRINGKSLVENGDDFRQFTFSSTPTREQVDSVVASIVRFAPHVITYVDSDGFEGPFLAPIEAAWRAPHRPTYASAGILGSPSLVGFVGTSTEKRQRFLGVELPANTEPNLKFVLHYNESYSPKITPATAPGVIYDTFYVLAYAAAASSGSQLTGPALSEALRRVRRDGVPIAVGPSQIFDAFTALRSKKSIKLAGAGSELDLDETTGEMPSDFSVYCLAPTGEEPPVTPVESGLRFNHAKAVVEGTFRCK